MLCAAIASPGETFTVLKEFGLTDGAQPWHMTLVQGLDGNFYGTTLGGGAQDGGTIFKIALDGTLTTIHSSCSQTDCPDGVGLDTGLMLAIGGSFYGTTNYGGPNGNDTIYRITPNGKLTTVHAFSPADGQGFYATLVQGTDGNFYGTTPVGGVAGWGTIFKLTPDGTFTTLYSFCTQTGCRDGNVPVAGLVLGTDWLTSLTNAFSRKLENHRAAVALHLGWYNFCQIHGPLKITPAMESGITDHVWSVKELLA